MNYKNYHTLISYGVFLNNLLQKDIKYFWVGRQIIYNYTLTKLSLKYPILFKNFSFFDLEYLHFLHHFNINNKAFKLTVSNLPGYSIKNDIEKKTKSQHIYLTESFFSIKENMENFSENSILNEFVDDSIFLLDENEIYNKYKENIVKIEDQVLLFFKNGFYSFNNNAILLINDEDVTQVKTKDAIIYENDITINYSLNYDEKIINLTNKYIKFNDDKNKSNLFKFILEKQDYLINMNDNDIKELIQLEFKI